ncbi:MAG: UDPGP type 1 family protein [Pirellulales bacterium]|nr:UDPGP type 1 family protein [Pirellulales bacterium]
MYSQLLTHLTKYNQQHILHFWDALSESERAQLARQIDAIDLAELAQLVRGGSGRGAAKSNDWAEMARRAKPPRTIRRTSMDSRNAGPRPVGAEEAQERGEAALAAGEVGVLLVAGGQGTRLGFTHPKGLYPIGPVSSASLIQIHIEKILAIAARYGVHIPLYLMTSPATHEETVVFLDCHERFGLPADDLLIFTQGTMPAVDASTGKLLLSEPGSLFLSPNGHGGTVAALKESRAIEDALGRGVQRLFYLQIDNPLVPICDAEFIGHHLLHRSEMSSLAIRKKNPDDKVGNFVSIDDQTWVIEYIDFPGDVANQREPDGSLRFWAGSIAIHIFDVAFLDRVAMLSDALPFHMARKKVPYLDKNGRRIQPRSPNALKFERFIFDLLPEARNTIIVEAAAEDVFGPLKNAPGAGQDTAEHVQALLVAQYHGWLRAAGAVVADGAAIEISPLFALDPRDVRERIQPGTVFEGRQYLR